MNDDYKKGLITGLAMQPLYVTEDGGEKEHENFCAEYVIPFGIVSDNGYCDDISFE